MQIRIDKSDAVFDCEADDTILRAALRAGHGFPYECNVGSCGNCKFELLEGVVTSKSEDASGLSDKDRQRNRYLGCQSRATSACRIKLRLNDNYQSTHRPQKLRGTLCEVQDLTHDMREFSFEMSAAQQFLPGQYALISIPGVKHQRAYSMSNVGDKDNRWQFQIKRVPAGQGSNALFSNFEIGQQFDFDGPYGMAYLRDEAPRDILCLAGGSGLAPMLSITRAAALHQTLGTRNIHFLYGGRAPRDICGEQQLRELPGFDQRIKYYPVISDLSDPASADWAGHTGFVHDAALTLFSGELADYEIYFAGPPVMGEAVQMMLYQQKVPQDQIHFDKFY